jgi:lipoprotein-releasing system permease protein
MPFAFEIKVAIRYFKAGGMQSVLTIMGVAVGVVVFIFIASLIGGLEKAIVNSTIGSISQVTLEAKDRDPRTLAEIASAAPGTLSAGLIVSRLDKGNERESKIDNWQPLIALLDREPGVTVVSPSVSGPGFALRGSLIKPITFRGIVPERSLGIIDLQEDLVTGRYDVSGQNCVIGAELAKDLGAGLHDKIRTRSGKGRELVFTIAGIFRAGVKEINERSLYLSLTNAQRLLDLVGYLTAVEMKIDDVFQANAIADRLAPKTGLKASSWMRDNKDILAALNGQSGTSLLIKIFVMISVAFGIASVLIVTVVQKSREIGILKSMGARTRSITLIFLLQGLFVGLIGSLVGCVLGSGLVWLILLIPGEGGLAKGKLFPAELELAYLWQAFAVSVLIGMAAGIAPARRAAQLDPVEVIRYG